MDHSKTLFFYLCTCLFAVASVCVEAKIVYSMDDDIYICNDDGSSRRRLTNNPLWKDVAPSWSPDGKKIVFARKMDKKRTSTYELFIMNADGTNLKRLTHNSVSDNSPRWSPDGNKIVYTGKLTGQFEVYVMDVETLVVTKLTGIEGEQGSSYPDWSPDGTEIVYEKFVSNGGGFAHSNLYVMSANGENQRPLFPNPEKGVDTVIFRTVPRWSFGGHQIVFDDGTQKRGKQKWRLTVLRIGGRTKIVSDIYDRLGDNLLLGGISWMDNDRALLFEIILLDKPNANYDLYRYEFETKSLKRLTKDPRNEGHPDWIEGPLSVSPHEKLPTQWGEKKKEFAD